MLETEDRAAAAGGSGDTRALQSTRRLLEDLVDALLGQVRRVGPQREAALLWLLVVTWRRI